MRWAEISAIRLEMGAAVRTDVGMVGGNGIEAARLDDLTGEDRNLALPETWAGVAEGQQRSMSLGGKSLDDIVHGCESIRIHQSSLASSLACGPRERLEGPERKS